MKIVNKTNWKLNCRDKIRTISKYYYQVKSYPTQKTA